jgi:hypothetical protein
MSFNMFGLLKSRAGNTKQLLEVEDKHHESVCFHVHNLELEGAH